MESTKQIPARQKFQHEFWLFLFGETVSNLGSSVTFFALPLLVFRLTGSALNLSIATIVNFLPYLLFGLVIGVWVDRLNRKRLMIYVDIASAICLASIPMMAALGLLTVWWVYIVGFVSSSLAICFDAAEFAAIPNLVPKERLVTANGRIQASYYAATTIGPLLAGLLIAVVPVSSLFLIDAFSFLVSALALLIIRTSFNGASKKVAGAGHSVRQEIGEGLRYVWRHPVLRNISIMMFLVNLVSSTRLSQLVFFAKDHLHATDTQVGWLYSAAGIGVAILSLLAGYLRTKLRFSIVSLGALMVSGVITIIMALTTSYWLALVSWALIAGLVILFNVNTTSLRQEVVPHHMLGRVATVARVLAWSANPVGAFVGGIVINWTQNVSLIYAMIGISIVIITCVFSFTAVGHAERYLADTELPNEIQTKEGSPAT